MDEKKHNIFYKTTNTVNGKYYYGIHSTNNLEDGYLGSGRTMIKAIKKYGRKNFTREVIADYPTRKQASKHEALVVTSELVELVECYNGRTGGENSHSPSDEVRKKMSISHIGNKHSAETINKMIQAQSGEKGNNFGKKASIETREKLSKQRAGVKRGSRNLSEDKLLKNRNQKTCTPCEILSVYYSSVRDACRILGIPRTTLIRRLKSKNDEFKEWKYC